MKHYLLSALLILAAPALAQKKPNSARAAALKTPIVKGVLSLDAKNGFRAYKFGTPMDKISGLRKVDVQAFDGNVFERPSEPMGIGPVHLSSLLFIGIKGRLGGIVFTCSGDANNTNLLAILKQQYGPGLEYSESHVSWPGKRVSMDYSIVDEKCTVVIGSNAAANERAGIADDAAIKKGAGDL